MIIYIRHGEKAFANRKGPKRFGLDPGLTEAGKEEIRALTRELLEKYPVPKKIVSSPYLRCRESLHVILEEFKDSEYPEVYLDSKLGEYLGHQMDPKLWEFTPETYACRPYIETNINQLKLRIRKHEEKERTKDNIWVITHGLIMNILFEEKIEGCCYRTK